MFSKKLMACIGLFGLLAAACMAPAVAGQPVYVDVNTPMELTDNDLTIAEVAVTSVDSGSVDGVTDAAPSVQGAMGLATAHDARIFRPVAGLTHQTQSRCFTCPEREPGWLSLAVLN